MAITIPERQGEPIPTEAEADITAPVERYAQAGSGGRRHRCPPYDLRLQQRPRLDHPPEVGFDLGRRGPPGDQDAEFHVDGERLFGQIRRGQEQPPAIGHGALNVQETRLARAALESLLDRFPHGNAVVADAGAEASRVPWVVAEMVTEVAVADAFAVVARCLACGVAIGVVETVGRGLHLQLCDRIHIIDS